MAGLTKRRYRKVTVLIMRHQGHSAAVIEAALGLDDNTIYRYEQAYHQMGLERFLDDHYVAYAGRLSEEQEQALAPHLNDYLYPDAKSMAAYGYEHFGVPYSSAGMTALLKRLGFVYKKSKAVAAKSDEAAQCLFVEEQLPALLEEAARGEAVVYFADGCHPTHNTETSRGWIRRGQDFVIDCNSGRKRVNINAAINALKPEHLVSDLIDSVNAQSIQRLCRQLLKKHPGRQKKIYLVCDNGKRPSNCV
ncbi:IS630 family transposase [Neolewinella litorea]|uniref:IS630 family transposase n=1 Tax=Neolewinella litorea TaxID=2562452 RepID=A0A4S4NFP2_9BACT|nr:IS630 family transposase [Neolewinella litorea]THH37625.1 IS630 family transposase [Neolewinella litorea]